MAKRKIKRNPHPSESGVKNYKNTPYNKAYRVEIYVGASSPAGELKIATIDKSTGKVVIVPYRDASLPQYVGSGFLIGPPSVPLGQSKIQLGPYKSRRAAAVDAKTIIRMLLRGYAAGSGRGTIRTRSKVATGNRAKKSMNMGGSIIEMYELTEKGERYMQRKKFPPSSKCVKGAGKCLKVKQAGRNPIVVGYAAQVGTSTPVYARIYTILPDDNSMTAKKMRQSLNKPFKNAWKALGLTTDAQIKRAIKGTEYDNSEGYDVLPKKRKKRRTRR